MAPDSDGRFFREVRSDAGSTMAAVSTTAVLRIGSALFCGMLHKTRFARPEHDLAQVGRDAG